MACSSTQVSCDPSAIPESEERVSVYQKPGTEAFEELEAKRKRYVELDKTLVELPKKLSHRALVPLAPGLFAHGKLVNTNDILVLLGDNYFARMSAHSARQVVERRTAVIDAKLDQIDVGREEARIASEKQFAPVRKKPPPPAFAPGFLDAAAKTAPPPPSGRKPPRSPKKPHAFSQVKSVLRTTDSPRRARAPGSVKFADDVGDTTTQTSTAASNPANGTTESNSEPSSSATDSRNRVQLIENFKGSLEMAKKHQSEQGIVNLEELVDDDNNVTSVHGLPKVDGEKEIGIRDRIVTEDDMYEDLLDINPGKQRDSYDAIPYLKALLELEQDAKDKEQQRAAEEAAEERERESREFGTGLARGFFGAPEKKEPKPEPDQEPLAVGFSVQERGGSKRTRRRRRKPVTPAPQVFNVTQDANQENPDDDDEDVPPSTVSRFKQMQSAVRS